MKDEVSKNKISEHSIFVVIGMIAILFIASIFLEAMTAPAETGQHEVELVKNTTDGAFGFVINGSEVARLDVNGLHVKDSIEFGGALTDTGADADEQDAMENAP